MRAADDHQRAANAVAVAACELNRALAEADRAGLVVELVVLDGTERPSVRRIVARAMLPFDVTSVGQIERSAGAVQ